MSVKKPLYKIKNRLKQWRLALTPLIQYKGRNKNNNAEIIFAYAGWDKKLRFYWLNRFSDEYIFRHSKRIIFTKNLREFFDKRKEYFNVVIIESNQRTSAFGNYGKSFLMPRWMEMIIDINSSLKKSRTKEIRRRIRKNSLEYEFRNTRKDFDLFYYKMYKPLVEKNHRNTVELASYNLFLRKFLNGQLHLLFITRRGEPIAAQLIEKKEDTYRITAFGIMDGQPEIQKMGVHAALYYYAMNHYAEEGHQYLLCGSSMPIIQDGVTQFKIRLGAKPYVKDIENRKKYFFLPMNNNSSLMEFLKENSLFCISEEKLNIVSFINTNDIETKDDFIKYYKQIKCDNIENTKIYFIGNSEKMTQWIIEEGIEKTEFINYENEANSSS